MEYGYSFEDEAPRYDLGSLWFLIGVGVFAFSVLIVASILNNAGSAGMHLANTSTRQEQTASAPAVPARPATDGNHLVKPRGFVTPTAVQ